MKDLLKIIEDAVKDRRTTLYLRYRKLTALPSEIGKPNNLKVLYLNTNQLIDLPPEIGNLTNLTKLDLQGNKLNHKQMGPELNDYLAGMLLKKIKEEQEEIKQEELEQFKHDWSR